MKWLLLMCQLMAPAKEDRLRRMIPSTTDEVVNAAAAEAMLYTDVEMPQCSQERNGALPGVHSVHYNLSADQSERVGQPHEFPWRKTGGTDNCQNVETFRFLSLPEGKPVVWYRHRHLVNPRTSYCWIFPKGAIVGEVMMMRDPSGRRHTFEMRTRRREYTAWEVDVFRPFPNRESLSARIKELRPDWMDRPQLVRLVGHLDQERTLPVSRTRNRHPRLEFEGLAGVDALPPTGDAQLVSDLLTKTRFESCLGETWRDTNPPCEAPTTQASWHIVPRGYAAHFIRVDSTSCMDCHKTTQFTASEFDGFRDWYSSVRGSDGIFSFHPFSRSSISQNGFSRPVSMNFRLEQAGMLERYNRARHPVSDYQRIPAIR